MKITEEWIEEKAIEIYNLSYYKSFQPKQIAECIRSLLEELGETASNANARDAYSGYREDE